MGLRDLRIIFIYIFTQHRNSFGTEIKNKTRQLLHNIYLRLITNNKLVSFNCLTYLGLLVKVRGQLNQPRRLNSSHVTHVVF